MPDLMTETNDPLELARRAALARLQPGTLKSAALPASMDAPAIAVPSLAAPSLGPSTRSVDVSTPPAAPGLAAATLDPKDAQYSSLAPRGLKRVGLQIASAFKGLPGLSDPATAALNAPAVAYQNDVATQKQQLDAQKENVGVKDTESQVEERHANALKALRDPAIKPENAQQLYADAVADAQSRGVDPAADPKTLQIADAIQRLQKDTPVKPDTATQDAQRYENIQQRKTLKQPVSPEESAWAGAYEKQRTLTPIAASNLAAPTRADARSDKSYQYNSGVINKTRTPVDAMVARLGRLNDTLAQNSPQADALIAPELMTVMAGGAGSGIRINEAEINRIVGGRSKWQDLQAAINKWSLDPKAALSITPEQRKQIRDLTKVVNDKVQAKQKILDQAEEDLNGTDDVSEHRKITARMKKDLSSVDSGVPSTVTTSGVVKPKNATEFLKKYGL